jgi:hypothetical protein
MNRIARSGMRQLEVEVGRRGLTHTGTAERDPRLGKPAQ